MKITLKKNALIAIGTQSSGWYYVHSIKDINFNLWELSIKKLTITGNQQIRSYHYNPPYPIYNDDIVYSIEWIVNDENEVVIK